MSAVRRAARLIAFVAGGVAVLWLSAHITVRLPLAVPVLLIGVILFLVAVGHRRPPAGLFADEPVQAPAAAATSTAIPMPPVTKAPAPPAPAAAWDFNDDRPGEEDW
ncbi:hypothetical protein [Actinoallomurus iriomotensis]|uniref:Uncharacterized protein n=1 Tax=Actinoallomurus iriomotensis TaxID=478107 RepID=A0A9W6RSN6_9ACTN|nr:hypothetical protein [Actinoallomurus iriomotensis]GLY81806.1 hypothetical protein Airi01_100730 [Actinoallomurus iriomotensis]